MATELMKKKVLALNVEEGMDENGEPIIKRYSYTNVLPSASAQGLHDAGQALAGLYAGTLTTIEIVSTTAVQG